MNHRFTEYDERGSSGGEIRDRLRLRREELPAGGRSGPLGAPPVRCRQRICCRPVETGRSPLKMGVNFFVDGSSLGPFRKFSGNRN